MMIHHVITSTDQKSCAEKRLRNEISSLCSVNIDMETTQCSNKYVADKTFSRKHGNLRKSEKTVSHFMKELDLTDNILKNLNNGHMLVAIKKARLKGFCVICIKSQTSSNYKKSLKKVLTYCPACPGGNWICHKCFDVVH